MRVLRTVLIAPSRYDSRGVAIFRLGMSPNGALGALCGLSEDYNRRHAGRSRIDYEFFDEHVREPVTPAMLRSWRDAATAAGARFVVMLCGIQTVTYCRGRDIALMARREGIDVIAGGVHLSAHSASVEFLLSCGVHVAIGEVEPIWDDLVEDALEARLRSVYRIRADQGMSVKTATSSITVPDVADVPFPHIPKDALRRYVHPSQMFIDSSRGCPFLCTFCVVKNVFGRTVRGREPARLAAWMLDRVRHRGIRAFWLTDDNFVRSPHHKELLERLAAGRAEGLRFALSLILDVESACYAEDESPRGERTREFLRLCEAAGVAHVFMGLESTNDAVLREMRKGVNRDRSVIHGDAAEVAAQEARRRLVDRYRTAVRAWHRIGASVECAYILGFEADGRGAGREAARDIVAIDADVTTFYLLAPLPGSEDYERAMREGTLLEHDFNEFFTNRPMVAHPTLPPEALQEELRSAVRAIWTWRNVGRRIGRRLLGIDGKRAATPWSYVKRQIGCKWMVDRGMLSYSQGGLLRRSGFDGEKRHVVTDAEARRFYLGEGGHAATEADRAVQEAPVGSLLGRAPLSVPDAALLALRLGSLAAIASL
jgi:radical SAM superfamily enzyme YgiQ (UPF0313 family)